MSIQVNAGANAVNWEGLLSKLGEVEKTKDVGGKETLTLTMNVDGESKVCTISVPNDLEVPQKVDTAAVNTIVAKLQESGLKLSPEQMAAFKESFAEAYTLASTAVAEAKGSSTRGVMFDLYALMALLVEVAQKQRDAAREMRNAENASIRVSIQNQAEEQKSAARWGLGLGLGFGGLSLLLSGGMMVKTAIAMKQQSQIVQNSDIGAASMKAKMLSVADTPVHAKAQLTSVETRLTNSQNADIKGIPQELTKEFNGLLKNGTVKNEYTSAKADLVTAKADAKAATGKTEAALAAKTAAQKQCKTNESLFGGAKKAGERVQELESKQAELKRYGGDDNIKKANELDPQIKSARKALADFKKDEKTLESATKAHDSAVQAETNANTRLEQKQKAFDGAREEYIGTVRGFAGKYEGQYKSALQRLNNAPKGANTDALKSEVSQAKAKMEMAQALEANELAQPGVLSTSERFAMVNAAESESNSASSILLNQNEDYKTLANSIQKYMGWNGIIQALNGMVQTMAQNVTALEQANATRIGAQQKEQEEMLDQTKDLFQQAQKLVDAAVQLMNAVRQAETQSMRDAIQA